MIGTAFLLEKKRPGLTVDQINGLDRNTISVFDRNATHNWNTTAAKWSDGLMISTGVLPLLFLIDERSRKDFGKVAMIYSEIFLVNVALTNLTKELVQRKRPYVYNPNVPLHEKMDKDATHSFFSGHVSLTAAMAFGFAQMYQDYFPNSPAKAGVWFGAAVLPLAVAILRNRAGKHFWTDVLVGYAVGAAVGILIPRLHKVKK
jgi:membrane-associated phospholipid phosphatase